MASHFHRAVSVVAFLLSTANSPLAVADDAPKPQTPAHGSRSYRAARSTSAPRVDGILDDAVWMLAPRDERFASLTSKPYGLPATEPTAVQVAYDEEYLYVAFRCSYSGRAQRDDGIPPDETSLLRYAESVGVVVDALHDHANGRLFVVGRTGARADLEYANNGDSLNLEWRGIWDAATRHDGDGWTAELRIPWGTLGVPAHEDPFDVGINFVRREPVRAEISLWSLQPPGIGPLAMTYFGHLEGMTHVHPSQRLFIQPYSAVTLRQDGAAPVPGLRDFFGTASNPSFYGGLYARYRPTGLTQLDLALNPDFSQVSPDQAVVNLDRFELSYPELRPFFAEDKAKFEFGRSNAQLFYTRRAGLRTADNGAYVDVPIVYGAKALVRESGTEVAAMNVTQSPGARRIALDDNISILRINHAFGKGRRVGNILLYRLGGGNRYGATGLDGAYTMFDEHLTLSGFLAESATAGAGKGGVGQASADWSSHEFQANLSYLDVDSGFDPQLGYFPFIGIRSTALTSTYSPQVHNDLVRQVVLSGSIDRTRDRNDVRVFDRVVVLAEADMLDGAYVQAKLLPAVEQVAKDFKLAANRLTIPAGRYDVVVAQFTIATPPRRVVEAALGYLEGDLFGAYRRVPSATLGVNLGRYTGSVLYQLFFIRNGAQELTGHQLSARSTITYTPLARSTLIIEANTLNARAVMQLVNAYTFGSLSTIAFVVSGSSGADPANPLEPSWYANPNVTAIASFAYGLTPF